MAKLVFKQDLGKLLEQWARVYRVLVPLREKESTHFARWDGKDTSFLAWYRNTAIPPKESFLPNLEELFRYQKGQDGYQLEVPPVDNQPRLVFAIRACDASALSLLDKAFQDGVADPYYLPRRQNTLLVGLTCTRPYDTCFCTSLGGEPAGTRNMDIMLTDIGEAYLIEVASENGAALLAKTTGLTEANAAAPLKAKATRDAARTKVTRQVNISDIDKRLLAVFEDKEFWQQVAAKCTSCGTCTFLCPTCYCFDMVDVAAKGSGRRQRCWDSCQFTIYTQMPAENPREEKWRRVRQKVAHKYEFFPMLFGTIGCTGCGRCIRQCPVNWDISQVVNLIPNQVAEISR